MHWAMHHIAIMSANRTESDFANELGYLSGANSSFSSSLLVGRQLGLKVFSSTLLPERGLRPETRKHSRKGCKVAWSCRNLCHSSKDLEHPPRKLARKRHHLKKKTRPEPDGKRPENVENRISKFLIQGVVKFVLIWQPWPK